MKQETEAEPRHKRNRFRLNPLAIITLSFMFLILVGSALFSIPISHTENCSASYLDWLFLATSSVTVSGMTTMTQGMAEYLTPFGQVIQGILLQIGGIGAATIAVIFILIANGKLSFQEQALIKESWNLSSLKQIRKILWTVCLETLTIEAVGSVFLFIDFRCIHGMPIGQSIGYGIYHSISAFNNSGFDLLGSSSLINYENDIMMNIVLSVLVILGGLGYLVNVEIVRKKFNFRKMSFNTKVVLTYSLALTVIGTVLIYLVELMNESSNVSFHGAFFMSVSARTAGFSMYDLRTFNDATMIILCILMFIGASPGGTAAGIKTTTFACMIIYLRSIIFNNTPHAFRRSLSKETIRKALLIIILGFLFFITGFTIICMFEGSYNYIDLSTGQKYIEYHPGVVRYDALDFGILSMASFSTAGLTTGIVPYLSIGSKIVVMILMFVGRVGPVTISRLFTGKDTATYRLVEEELSIG